MKENLGVVKAGLTFKIKQESLQISTVDHQNHRNICNSTQVVNSRFDVINCEIYIQQIKGILEITNPDRLNGFRIKTGKIRRKDDQ